MKFTKIVLATLLAAGITAGTAQAQSTQLYGVAGAGVVSGTGFASTNSRFDGLGEQLHNSNRFGIKSSEDLGDGLKATLNLEGNMSLRNGAAGKDSASTGSGSSTLFDREANVSMSGGFGEVKLGRGKTHLYQIADEFDSRSNWNFGGLKPIARYAGFYSGSGVSRFDNMIRYTSPSFGGLVLDGAYSFGNQLGNNDYKKSYNVGGTYTAGDLSVAYNHSEVRLSTAVISEKIDLTAVKYAVTPALTVNAGYAQTRNPTAQTTYYSSSSKVDGKTDADTYFVGAKYKASDRVGLNLGYYSVKDQVTAGKDNVDMTAVGATYDFSKRTQVFVDYVVANRASGAVSPFTIYDRWIPNADGATYSDSKYKQQAVAIGVQYRF